MTREGGQVRGNSCAYRALHRRRSLPRCHGRDRVRANRRDRNGRRRTRAGKTQFCHRRVKFPKRKMNSRIFQARRAVRRRERIRFHTARRLRQVRMMRIFRAVHGVSALIRRRMSLLQMVRNDTADPPECRRRGDIRPGFLCRIECISRQVCRRRILCDIPCGSIRR